MTAEIASEPHEPHWISREAFSFVSAAQAGTQVLLATALYHGWTWLAVPLVLILAHLMHGLLVGFHEASHGMLRRRRWLNDLDGVLLGALSFMSFTLYRAAHQTHHMHLGTERDEELWPFVLTKTPRWARILAAVSELALGMIFTPLLFLRTFLRAGSPIRSPRVRRRIWKELALIVAVWSLVLGAVAWFDLWKYFLWMFLAPAWLGANLQSWRKYIEHVGLTGATIRSATRSIVATGPLGRLISFTLLHEPYHGVHHQRAGLPHAELPQFAADLEPENPDETRPFGSYGQALRHLLRSLADPRVGAQWRSA